MRAGTGHHYAAAGREIAGFEAAPADYEAAFGLVMAASQADLFAPIPAGLVDDEAELSRWRGFTARLFAALGCADHLEALWRRLREVFTDPGSWEPYEDTHAAIDELRSRGIKLAIVSNWSTHLGPILEHCGLVEPFDAILGSCELGVEKPDPGIFRIALDALDVDADAALHVGDSVEADVAGARAAGIRPLLLDRDGRHPDHADRIQTLHQIVERL